MKKALKIMVIIILAAVLALPTALLIVHTFGGSIAIVWAVLWAIGPILGAAIILVLIGRWLFRKIRN